MPAPNPWRYAADQLDPPPPEPHLATPMRFATHVGGQQFQAARHLAIIEQQILHAIETSGRTIISVSVRHGKTIFGSRWVPAWYLGRNPTKRVLHATNTLELGRANSRAARDILTEHGPEHFRIRVARDSTAANRWDLDGHPGGMLAVGVGGSPIGWGGDLVIIDDPYGDYADAMSPTVRRAVIEWWTGTMESRINPGGAVVILMARWHPDDLAGFLLREAPDEWTEVRLPAICTNPNTDPMGRALGEALWPERYPVPELLRRKQAVSLALGPQVWDAQFQQEPKPRTGGMFHEDRWGTIVVGDIPTATRWVRGWDLAATEDDGDWTVGALLGLLPDGRTIVADVVRGRWNGDQVRQAMRHAADHDPAGTHVELPQDPGQAGKDQGQQLVRHLAGHSARALPQTGSKVIRATPLSAQQQAGNVLLLEGAGWRNAFIAECTGFPKGSHDDQVDAAATAFNALVRAGGGDGAGEWRDDRLTGRR